MLVYLLLTFICIISFIIFESTYVKTNVLNYFELIKKKILLIVNNKDLPYKDIQNILNFLQNKLKIEYIFIPNNIAYEKVNKEFIFNDVKIIEIKNIDNKEISITHKISFKFIPVDNNIFTSNQELFGLSGRFELINQNNINELNDIKIENTLEQNNNKIIKEFDTENILNSVPDILHLTSESNNEIEIDSILETTENKNILQNTN